MFRPTVVLLHSSASSGRQWERLSDALQVFFRVHAIDLHGHGAQSDWRGDPALTLAADAALVEALVAGDGGAHVVGHSYGAAVALKLATLRPDLVHSLVAYEPVVFRLLFDHDAGHPSAHDVMALADAIRACLAQDRGDEAALRFVDFWSGTGAWASMPANRQHAVATRMPAVLRHFDALFREPFARAQLHRLEMPMLFLAGAGTVAATRRIGELLRRLLPIARHDVLARMGHMGPVTHAAHVNRRIAEFLHGRRFLARPAARGGAADPLSGRTAGALPTLPLA
jgi:pimeloyl-ACP methyl ester carboxylesterase